MKIVIINGSYRKNGATALILHEMYQKLGTYPNVEIQFYNVADLNLKYCVGCCKCYKNGKCIFNDDIEKLSRNIKTADGIIIGSPTYASNVSGQMKVLIDRGHFVIEQLLFRKYAVSVSTYENYGGKDTSKILNRLLSYSGATISNSLCIKVPFSSNPLSGSKTQNKVNRAMDKFYNDIYKQKSYLCQKIKHFIIFRFGIFPFVIKKGSQYQGVISKWKKQCIKVPEISKVGDIGMTTGEKIRHFRNLRGISQETLGQLSDINSATIKISFKNSMLNHKLGVYMKARELQENLLNDTERFSSEEEHQRAIEALSKDLDAVKQSILDDSKIVKKGVRDISVKIYPENE